MILKQANAPFVKKEQTVKTMMRDTIVALLFLLVLPVAYHGFRVAAMAGITVVTCVAAEILFSLIARKELAVSDLSSIVTGLIITLLMPVSAPFWLPVVAALVAILVVKGPFGGTGHTLFNPAAAGVAFVTVCWSNLVFDYLKVNQEIEVPFLKDLSIKMLESPTAALKSGLKPNMVPFEMLWGQASGPLGTTAVLVVAACGLFIILKNTANWQTSLSFLLSAALYAAIFPRFDCTPLTSIKYELLSGSLVFCALFLITEPSTTPRTLAARCIYGALGGIFLMVLRNFGEYEQGACFAILLVNALSPCLDNLIISTKKAVLERKTAINKGGASFEQQKKA